MENRGFEIFFHLSPHPKVSCGVLVRSSKIWKPTKWATRILLNVRLNKAGHAEFSLGDCIQRGGLDIHVTGFYATKTTGTYYGMFV
jgi:hypothetical protein